MMDSADAMITEVMMTGFSLTAEATGLHSYFIGLIHARESRDEARAQVGSRRNLGGQAIG